MTDNSIIKLPKIHPTTLAVLRSLSRDFDTAKKPNNKRSLSKKILLNASSDFTSVTSNNPYNEAMSTITGGKSSKMTRFEKTLKPPLQGIRKRRTK